MKFNANKIRQDATKNFEETWLKAAGMLGSQKSVISKVFGLKSKSHAVCEIMERFRQSFLNSGFTEVIIPAILEEDHVYRQYGPEAPVILDRCYYLAGMPRPDIGLGSEKIEQIKKIAPTFKNFPGIQDVLRRYKKGEVEGDDFVEELVKIGLQQQEATQILENVFSEFKSLKPEPSELILRSHMTSSWFPVLATMVNRSMPVALFTIGLRFRREQKEDTGHLRAHHGASCVVMDPEVSLKDGEELVKKILAPFGFKEFKFVTKKATSKYYTYGMEVEAYAKLGDKWLEIADFGLYNPIALANYGIEYPVMNLGIGVERVAMILTNSPDIRVLEYPYLSELELNDKQISEMIGFEQSPQTPLGKEVAKAVYDGSIKHANDVGVCSSKIWEGKVGSKKLVLEVYEHDEGKNLLHPGAFNKLWVKDGSILGLPEDKFQDLKQGGIDTGINYLQGIAQLVGAKVENGEVFDLQVKVVKNPSDINISIDPSARAYITSKNKKIDVRGPVFLDIRCKAV